MQLSGTSSPNYDDQIYQAVINWDGLADPDKRLVGCNLRKLKERGLGDTLLFAHDAAGKWSIKSIDPGMRCCDFLNRCLIAFVRALRYLGLMHLDTRLLGAEKDAILKMRKRLHSITLYEPLVDQTKQTSDAARAAREIEEEKERQIAVQREVHAKEREIERQKQKNIEEVQAKKLQREKDIKTFQTLVNTYSRQISEYEKRDYQNAQVTIILETKRKLLKSTQKHLQELTESPL